MRTLIKGYTFTAGTRSIDCSNCNTFDIENIRLIVNETQKFVICSSMQKDLIVSIIDGVITYADTLPLLSDDDKLTIEIDYSYNISSGLMNKGLLTNRKSMLEILVDGDFNGELSIQIDDNEIETISRLYAFAYMKNLTAVSMSNLKSIVSYAFQSCSNVTTVSLPAAQSIGTYAFAYCSNVTTVSLPAAQSIGGNAFANCSNITTVSFGKLTSFISSGTFSGCYKLSNIIIGAGTNINLDISSLSNATWNANINTSIWNENFVSGIINNLFDFTAGVAHTIKCGAYPYAKLTPETIALAAAKNWNITA